MKSTWRTSNPDHETEINIQKENKKNYEIQLKMTKKINRVNLDQQFKKLLLNFHPKL